MTSVSATLSAAALPELIFLAPTSGSRRIRLPVAKLFGQKNRTAVLRCRIRAVRREESVVLEESDRELARKVNGSANGNVNGGLNGHSGVAEKYSNGSLATESQSLVKYVNGNGGAGRGGEEVLEVKATQVFEKKKTVEEIGQEEAWFKKKGTDQVEVC